MADALAAFGFGEVAAYPTWRRHFLERGMGWELAAFDGNRYPPGNIGRQQQLAVSRQARAIARAHDGFATGGSVSGTGRASVRHRGPGPPPVLRHNPGSRPRIPPVPTELTRLAPARDDQDWSDQLLELVQTILATLLLGGALTAARRCGVYQTLIDAASRYAEDVITGADIVAATGRPPQPPQWAAQARGAVGAVVPDLLARWDSEPPANRLALAALAAIFRSHGQVLASRVAALAAGKPEYDMRSELLDQAMLAEAILCQEVGRAGSGPVRDRCPGRLPGHRQRRPGVS